MPKLLTSWHCFRIYESNNLPAKLNTKWGSEDLRERALKHCFRDVVSILRTFQAFDGRLPAGPPVGPVAAAAGYPGSPPHMFLPAARRG